MLSLCPTLKDRLKPGCRIVNTDPVVLAIVIEHLQTISVFGFMSIGASGSLSNLASGEQSLLNFAKAWHVLDMLRMPELQNKLLKIYRKYYLKCVKRVRNRLQLSELKPLALEPFAYLRDNLGYHSKAEKFLIDFHAGLMRYQRRLRLSDFRLLTSDIRDLVTDRWLQLCGKARKDSHQSDFNHDRIAAGDPCYKVTQNESIEHSVFQIQYLYGGSGGRFGLNPPLPVSPQMKRRKSSQTTVSSASAGTRSSPRGSADPVKDLSQPRLDDPFESSSPEQTTGYNSESVSPSQVLFGQNTPQIASRSSLADRSGRPRLRNQASHRSSVSFASDLPSHAPFMSGSPNRSSWWHVIGHATATDAESVYDLFAPNLGWTDSPPDVSRELGIFSVLDFAA